MTDIPTEPEVFCLAEDALTAVITAVGADQWDLVVPKEMLGWGPDREVRLRELVVQHAYDDAWVPDMLAGRAMDDVKVAGEDPYAGDLLGDDPTGAFTVLAERAKAAARGVDDLDRVVHCSFGDFPAREYLWQVNSYRGLRAVDIARLVGADDTLPDALVEGLIAELTPHLEEWRAMGLFGPAQPVGPGATRQQQLLGMTGRRPG